MQREGNASMDQTDDEVRGRIDEPFVRDRVVVDPFMADPEVVKSYDNLDANFKRRATRQTAKLEKVFAGTDANSKQLIPDKGYTSAYGLMDVVIPPYNLDELAGFYESNTPNRASINAKVANIVGLGYDLELTPSARQKLEEATSDNALKNAHKRVEAAKQDLIEWLDDRNDEDTLTHTLEKMLIDYESTGNGYIEIGRITSGPRKGEIGYIGHVPATTIRVRRKRDGYVQIIGSNVVFFNNYQEGKTPNPITSDPTPNEMIHFKKYTPKNSYYGIPDILAASVAAVGDQLAGKYNIDYFENKAVPRYVVILKGAKLTDGAQERLFRFLQSGLRGQNHRTLYIPLPGDTADNKVSFDMKPIESGIQDGSFEKYRKSNRDEVLMAHTMPISKVGGGGGQALAAALAADRTFKEQVARPSQRSIEKKFQRIIKEQTDMFKFKLNELTLTDENTQSMIDERYLKYQVVVPNEIRPRIGLPMRDGGSEPFEMKPQQAADAKANGNRTRDAQRNNESSDSTATTAGRNPAGEGRSSQ